MFFFFYIEKGKRAICNEKKIEKAFIEENIL